MRNNKKNNSFVGVVFFVFIMACAIVPQADIDDQERLEHETCKLMLLWDDGRKAGVPEHLRDGVPVSKEQRQRCEDLGYVSKQ